MGRKMCGRKMNSQEDTLRLARPRARWPKANVIVAWGIAGIAPGIAPIPDVGVTTDARAHPHWLTANLNMVRGLPNHGSSERVCPRPQSSPGLADGA